MADVLTSVINKPGPMIRMNRNRRRSRTGTAAVAVAFSLVMITVGGSGPVAADPSTDEAPASVVAATDRSAATALAAAAERAGQQRSTATNREPGGVDPASLDSALRELVDDGAVAVTARVQTPTSSWAGAAGVRKRDHWVPAQRWDRFRAASLTKPMIATLVLQEVERGSWELSTPVSALLTGLFPDEVTIGQLLSHRSGAPTGTAAAVLSRMSDPNSVDEFFEVIEQDFSDAELIAAARTLPWVHEPGTDFNYSNAGYVLLGMMLEKVTGQSVGDLLEARVFARAGMWRSDFAEGPGTRGPFMVGSAYTGDAGAGWYSLQDFNPDVFSSSGAVVSTTEDLNDFTAALVGGRLVGEDSVQKMLTPRTHDPLDYGLGVLRVPDPCVPGGWLYGHDGMTYGSLSYALTSPDGSRQVSLGVTGRNVSADPDALYDVTSVLVPLLQATC